MKITHYAAPVGLLLLAACSAGTVKDTLGLDRSPPDEFRVVSRPPLSVPPDFTLRPPSTSDTNPNQPSAAEQAKSLIQGKPAKTAGKPAGGTSAESQFLKHAGADKADADVRGKLVDEKMAVQDEKDNSSWWDIFSSEPTKKDPIVNAKEEAKRIEKNEGEGKPVTEGDTPEVKPRDRGILGAIFGN